MPASISPDQFLDPRWRLNNLYSVIDKRGKLIPFRTNAVQMELLNNVHSRMLNLKARQFGVTTFWCLVMLDDCLFTPNVRAAVIAHKMDDAKVIFRDKIKGPYNHLDEALKAARPASQDSADTMTFENGSSVRVSTSVRSATVNWLLISEYGKICTQFPEKAIEIKTGAFPAAEQGVIIIESTAEGEGGDFYDKAQTAQQMLSQKVELTRKDYKFFFFPWWRAPEYQMERTNIPIGPDDEAYFERIGHEIKEIPFLAEHFKGFSQEQKNWYVTEEREQGGNMKREYPSTPQEAFAQALEGAIFADDIAAAYKHDRIGHFPLDARYPVNTFWDLGRSHGNATAIWLEQDIQGQPRMVGYFEFEGEMIDAILRKLKEWALDNNVSWGKHYMPHDGDRELLWLPEGTLGVMGRLGFNPAIVSRAVAIWESVQVARRRFSQVQWDAEGCKLGLTRLKRYRKEFDERRGVWRDHPYHGPESNGADAYRTFAESGHLPAPPVKDYSDDAHRRRFYERNSEESWMTQ